MTIKHVQGNLLKSPAEALVNTVNTVGVMGKGIALQFKQAFPAMFKAYAGRCKSGELQLGMVFVYDLGPMNGGPRWIINFPTKGHWRSKSNIKDIQAGLQDLVATMKRLGIRSIAIPPLGCGHGGLNWAEVLPMIESAFAGLEHVEALIYAPDGAPSVNDMPNKTSRPKMTEGRASLIVLMDRYLKGMLDPCVSLLEVHKLIYFLQTSGAPLRLNFEKSLYGPYASNLRHVLIHIDSHFIRGYGDGNDTPYKPLELIPEAISEAHAFLQTNQIMQTRMDRVSKLIDGFETSYGMELLSSVHWVMLHEVENSDDLQQVTDAIHRWNPRKKRTLKPEHIKIALLRLKNYGWDGSDKALDSCDVKGSGWKS